MGTQQAPSHMLPTRGRARLVEEHVQQERVNGAGRKVDLAGDERRNDVRSTVVRHEQERGAASESRTQGIRARVTVTA